MPTVRLTIEGMKCDGCAQRVEDGLTGLDGTNTAEVDHEEGLAKVDVTTGTATADDLREAVEALDYEVTGVTPI